MFRPVEETDSTRFYEIGEVRIGLLKKNGYINATAICKACDKRVNNYLRTQETLSFLVETSQQEGIPMDELTIIRKGGDGEQGTWVHPIVGINLAQWASPSFAYNVCKWIIDWFNEARNPMLESDTLYVDNGNGEKSASLELQDFQPSPPLLVNAEVIPVSEDKPTNKEDIDITFFSNVYSKMLEGATAEANLPPQERKEFALYRRKFMQMCKKRMSNI